MDNWNKLRLIIIDLLEPYPPANRPILDKNTKYRVSVYLSGIITAEHSFKRIDILFNYINNAKNIIGLQFSSISFQPSLWYYICDHIVNSNLKYLYFYSCHIINDNREQEKIQLLRLLLKSKILVLQCLDDDGLSPLAPIIQNNYYLHTLNGVDIVRNIGLYRQTQRSIYTVLLANKNKDGPWGWLPKDIAKLICKTLWSIFREPK